MTDKFFIESTSLPGEEWKDIEDYNGLYIISNFGRIISLTKVVHAINRDMVYPIKFLSPSPNKKGYLYITLCDGISKRKRYIHRLVAQAFLSNPDNKVEIDHIDGNNQNNQVSNLRWSTRKENMLNPITRRRASEALIGSINNATSKQVAQYQGDQLISIYPSIAEACRVNTNFSQPCITRCCLGNNKTHRGYIWKFI